MRLLLSSFDDEHEVLEATRAARAAGLRIYDVYSPYPIHGIDEAMGLAPSRLTFACALFGLTGLVCAFLLQWWTSAVSWPLNVGGKPYLSTPAFIPIMFEMTVLFAGLGTVAALFLRTRLRPRAEPKFCPPGVTNDTFVLALDAGAGYDTQAAESLVAEHGGHDARLVEAP